MRRNYLNLLLCSYAAALLICVGGRTYLMLMNYISDRSGLYTGGAGVASVFNTSLLVFICAWFVMTVLRRGWGDYPVSFSSPMARALLLLTGVGILACVISDSIEVISRAMGGYVLPDTFSSYLSATPTARTLFILALKILTGLLGTASLIILALRGNLGGGKLRLLGIFPAVWQMIVLLERFTGYISPAHVSNTLLMILFMIFAPVFLIAQGCTICGLKAPDSRNYLIASGFAASLAGFSLTVPKIIRAAIIMDIYPGYSYMFFFHAYVFVFSLYAAVFLYSYIRAIRKV